MKKLTFVALVVILAACGRAVAPTADTRLTAVAQAEDPYTALLEQYHWAPQGAPRISSLALPRPESWSSAGGPPFNLYLEASRAIGLDFMPWAGQTLELRTYTLGRTSHAQREIYGHLIGEKQRVVGAWLSVEAEAPGIYPLSTSIGDLSYLSVDYRLWS